MIEDDFMLAGEFGTAARLSPKALRLYAEQGLLTPAHIDPATGYRYYRRDQIPRARLISRLRALELPLRRISTLLELSPDQRLAELRAWLAAQEDKLRHRRDLITTLSGAERTMPSEVRLRQVPDRKVLSEQQRVYIDGLDDFIAGANARIRTHLRASNVSDEAAARVHFHGMVTRDSSGPVEVTVPFTGIVEPTGDLRVRIEPAHTEAYLSVSEADAEFPGILRVYDELESWIDQNGYVCAESPIEICPGVDGASLDVAYPITTLKG